MAKLVDKPGQKKSYWTPTLRTFGNVQQITLGAAKGMNNDNPTGSHDKTGIAGVP